MPACREVMTAEGACDGTIVLSALLAAIIGRQPQLKDELIRAIKSTPTTNEDLLVRLKQKAHEFIESIAAPVN